MAAADWEAYYRSGALVSCPTTAEPCYSHEIREAWVEFFAALPSGAALLDLGTGNGAVAMIARETAARQGKVFEIHGADLARIDPFRDVPDASTRLAGIEFHAGVRCEALPFDANRFAAVCGQYILEYTDCTRSLAEAARVLRPGGVCQFILHHGESLIVRNARESLRQAALIADSQVLQRFRDYCERAAGGRAGAAAARQRLLDRGEELQTAARQSGNPLLLRFVIDTLSSLLAHRSRMNRGELERRTGDFEHRLETWVARLEDLAAAAPAPDRLDSLLAEARRSGFADIALEEQFQDGDKLVGWRLRMALPSR